MHVVCGLNHAYNYTLYRPCAVDVTIEYVSLLLDNAAILSGKKIARFYTISETQAAMNLYSQYVNCQ